jgi:hypothetical protein
LCASFSPLFQDSTLSQVLADLLPFLHVCADTLLPILTVEEMLLYTAELKRPRSIPLADKQAAVEELLDKLGLNTCRWAAASGCGLVSTVWGEYVTWTFSPNNNGIAHQGRAG